MSAVNCSMARLPLISALDVFSHPEIHNSHNEKACNRSTCFTSLKNSMMSPTLICPMIVASLLEQNITIVKFSLFLPQGDQALSLSSVH